MNKIAQMNPHVANVWAKTEGRLVKYERLFLLLCAVGVFSLFATYFLSPMWWIVFLLVLCAAIATRKNVKAIRCILDDIIDNNVTV